MSVPLTQRLLAALVLALGVLGLGAPAGAQPTQETLTIFVNEVTTWSPGYAMGDIVLGAPDTAGYEPTGGRRQLMLRGKREGRTTLNIWDQRKALRHEITHVVTTREAQAMEADLRRLLAPYPNVSIARLGAQTLLTGTVASEQELTAVANIAQIASARSTVTVARAAGPGRTATTTTTTAPGEPGVAPPPVEAEADAPLVEYELELFEASAQFKTGEYGHGVEPSGRSLYKGKVAARLGADGEIFIGGPAVDPKNKGDKNVKETGIRLTVRPREARGGGLMTAIEIETNVPLDYALYDPDVWRRSRYGFKTETGTPFAVSGNDLLAAPAIAGGMTAMGKVQRGTSAAGSIPGASGSGLQFVPVFGSLFGSSNYKSKKTQILVVFRPTVTGAP
jgi:hypothetical protein